MKIPSASVTVFSPRCDRTMRGPYRIGGDMDSMEQRERAQEAWEFALGHLVNKGCKEAIALETMAKVAFRTYAERQGSTAAASYFRLLSEQAEGDERKRAASMMWI